MRVDNFANEAGITLAIPSYNWWLESKTFSYSINSDGTLDMEYRNLNTSQIERSYHFEKLNDWVKVTFPKDGYIKWTETQTEDVEIVLPAYYLAYMLKKKNQDDAMTAVRVLGNLVAILLAVPTGGTTLVVVTALSAGDLVVLMVEDRLKASPEGRAFLGIWDAVQLADAGVGLAKGIYKVGSGAASKLIVKFNELPSVFKTMDPAKRAEFFTSLRTIPGLLNSLQLDNVGRLFNNRILGNFEAALLNSKFQTFGTSTMSFRNWSEGIVSVRGADVKVYELGFAGQGGYCKFADIRTAASQGDEVLGAMKEVRYQGAGSVVEGTVDIYRKADGSVYVVARAASSANFGQVSDGVLTLTNTDLPRVLDQASQATQAVTGSMATVRKVKLKFGAKEVEFDLPSGASITKNADGGYFIPGFCFVAGTQIQNADGSLQAIEDVAVGEKVLSFDHTQQRTRRAKVSQVFRKSVDRLAKVVVGGSLFISTLNHPYYANGQYTNAEDLHPGDSVLTVDGDWAAVSSVDLIDSAATVYNFEVEGQHNYFIGEEGYLVHNDCNMLEITGKVAQSQNSLAASVLNKLPDYFRNLNTTSISGAARRTLNAHIAGLAEDDLLKFLDDFALSGGDLQKFAGKPDMVTVWKSLEAIPSVRKNIPVLEGYLTLAAKKLPNGSFVEVQRLFDNGLANTLNKISITEQTAMIGRVGQWDATKVNDLARRLGDQKYLGLSDELADPDYFKLYDDIIHDPGNAIDIAKLGGDDLLNKVGRSTFFQDVTGLGKEFEAKMLREVLDPSSNVYAKLKQVIPDLADRKVLQQVQFCVPGKTVPCNAKGEYFIADLVFVKYNNRGKVVDMIVADSKLSLETSLTGGQTLAKNGVGGVLNVRTQSITTDATGASLPAGISRDQNITINGFYKVYGDGTGNFLGVQ